MTGRVESFDETGDAAKDTEDSSDATLSMDTAQVAAAVTPKSFRHQPLDLYKTQIRLFRLLPVRYGGHLTGTIVIHDFDSPDCPGYKAASYTWGPPHPTRDIYIDGQSFTIRENLWHFLNFIPNSKVPWYDVEKGWEYVKDGWLWIDQICIDQSAIDERNHQVNLMAKIYAKASSVLLWLGIEADGSDKAIEAIKSGSISLCREQVKSIFRRDYWSRLWILQEVFMANNILVLCGSKSIFWRDLVAPLLPPRAEFGDSPWHRPVDISDVALSLIEEKDSFYGASQRLSYVLDTFAGLKCEDTRDKVYGLLSLVRSSGVIPVDYSKTPEGVLFKAIEKIVMDERLMDFWSHFSMAMRLRDHMMLDDISNRKIYDFIENEVYKVGGKVPGARGK
ncbi:hypothetical protein NHQ30_006943 [Ciborinia camelliae]|nr:hypothetical protein NHQ30_006943 [Ciborinia camelliae]